MEGLKRPQWGKCTFKNFFLVNTLYILGTVRIPAAMEEIHSSLTALNQEEYYWL